MLVEIFWRNGVVEKKTPDTFFHGGFRPGHLYTHRPDLDLDFRKNVTWQGRRQKNVTWRFPVWSWRHDVSNFTWLFYLATSIATNSVSRQTCHLTEFCATFG